MGTGPAAQPGNDEGDPDARSQGALRAIDESLPDGEDAAPGLGSPRWSRGAFALALVLCVASVFASLWVRDTVLRAGALRLKHATERAGSFVQERAHAYSQILRGTGALFRASERVSPAEIEVFVRGLELQRNYTGLLGLGYSERVHRAELTAWLLDVRRERPGFQVTTSGNADELVINKLVEPLVHNSAALGFDISSEAVRSRALAVATRTGDLALTGRVRLRQDPTGAGFIMYLPIPTPSGADVRGYVFAALRARDLLSGIQAAAGGNVRLRVLDDEGVLDGPTQETDDEGVSRVDVQIADRRIVVEGRPGHGFFSLSDRSEPWAILLLGLGATALAFGLITSLRNTTARSYALAVKMTAELRGKERELRSANAALERLATTDALTGVYNRRVFDERIQEEIGRARRNGTPLSILMLDVDCFKLYNDTYGHPQGDECLKQVGTVLRGSARRAGEIAVRYGGEEFAVILPASNAGAAAQLADHVCDRIRGLGMVHEKNPHGVVTVSIGVAGFDTSKIHEPADLVEAADAALYKAKANGRNRVEIAG